VKLPIFLFIITMASVYAWDTAGSLRTHAKIVEDAITELNVTGEYL
jgi:hypothetical protein